MRPNTTQILLAVIAVLLAANLLATLTQSRAVAVAAEAKQQVPGLEAMKIPGMEGIEQVLPEVVGYAAGTFLPSVTPVSSAAWGGRLYVCNAGSAYKINMDTMKLEGQVDFDTPEGRMAKIDRWGKAFTPVIRQIIEQMGAMGGQPKPGAGKPHK